TIRAIGVFPRCKMKRVLQWPMPAWCLHSQPASADCLLAYSLLPAAYRGLRDIAPILHSFKADFLDRFVGSSGSCAEICAACGNPQHASARSHDLLPGMRGPGMEDLHARDCFCCIQPGNFLPTG